MTGFLCARVLATFREQTVKVEKCLFQSASISYLGFKVGPGQVKMDPEKVRAARTWPCPTLKSFSNFWVLLIFIILIGTLCETMANKHRCSPS